MDRMKISGIEMAFVLAEQHGMTQELLGMVHEMMGMMKAASGSLSVKQEKRLGEMQRRVEDLMAGEEASLKRKYDAAIKL